MSQAEQCGPSDKGVARKQKGESGFLLCVRKRFPDNGRSTSLKVAGGKRNWSVNNTYGGEAAGISIKGTREKRKARLEKRRKEKTPNSSEQNKKKPVGLKSPGVGESPANSNQRGGGKKPPKIGQ